MMNLARNKTMNNVGFIAIALFFVGCSGTSTENVEHSTQITDEFRRFLVLFTELNSRIESQTGMKLFSGAEDRGNGKIHVNATDAWHSVTTVDKTSHLNTFYKLWDTADESGRPITVCIRDADGNVVIERSGRY